MDPYEHRQASSMFTTQMGRVDVKVQAVLVCGARRERPRSLRATRCELGRVADTLPRGRTLRGLPPQVPSRGSSVGQPEEVVTPGDGDTADKAGVDVHNRGAV